MKKTVKVKMNESTEYFNGMWFDAELSNTKDDSIHEIVRFVFFDKDEELQRVMLSNRPEFDVASCTVPKSLRFADCFSYKGYLSPYGYRDNTIGDFFDLINQVFGSYRFKFIPNQEVEYEIDPSEMIDTFISDNYEENYIYSGKHSYHHSHGIEFNKPKKKTPYKIGVELEVEAKDATAYDKVCKYKSNWFTMERDGSLNDNGIEFVTIPLLPKDAKATNFWSVLTDALSKKSD